MNKKILTLGLVITLSTGLIIGCNKKEDKEETTKEVYVIQYVDDEGNVIKEKKSTKEEVKEIKEKSADEEVKEESKKEETKKKVEDKKSEDIKKETTKEQSKEDKKNDDEDINWDLNRCPACHRLLENCTCQTEYCSECGKEIDDCICDGDAPDICEDCGNTLDNCTCDQSWDENTCPACLRPNDECICQTEYCSECGNDILECTCK